MRSVVRVALSVTAAVVLVGCTSPSEPLPGLPSSTMIATAGPSPTPSPTIDYSDVELGIVFEDDTDLTGAEAEVYHWAAVYETESWRSLTSNTVSPMFSTIAAPEVRAQVQAFVDQNVGIRGHIDGVFRVQIGEINVEGDSARAVACLNYVDATFNDPNGSYTPDEVGFGGVTRQELTLARVSDQTWIVLTSTVNGKC